MSTDFFPTFAVPAYNRNSFAIQPFYWLPSVHARVMLLFLLPHQFTMNHHKHPSILTDLLILLAIVCTSTVFMGCAGHTTEPNHATFVQTCHADALDDAICEAIAAAPKEEDDPPCFQMITTPEEDIAILNTSMPESPAWQFTPEFVFEYAADAALDRTLYAIRTEDADAFCLGFKDLEQCKQHFTQNLDILQEAYLHKPITSAEYQSQTGDSNYQDFRFTKTIGPIKFTFADVEKMNHPYWQLIDVCTNAPELSPNFNICPAPKKRK